jgi:hypothetical protein
MNRYSDEVSNSYLADSRTDGCNARTRVPLNAISIAPELLIASVASSRLDDRG